MSDKKDENEIERLLADAVVEGQRSGIRRAAYVVHAIAEKLKREHPEQEALYKILIAVALEVEKQNPLPPKQVVINQETMVEEKVQPGGS